MIRYAQTHRCRRQMILDYFGDEFEVSGCHCDVCRRGHEMDDPQADAPQAVVVSEEVVLLCRQLLSAIARLNGKFGVGVVAEVLAGSDNEKSQRWAFNKLSVFGLLRASSDQAHRGHAASTDGGRSGPPTRPRRNEIPPRG